MTDRRPLDDAELIERLGALSGRLAWPQAPGLAGRVTAALEAGAGRAAGAPGAGGFLGRLRELLGAGGAGGRRVARRSLLIAIVALLAIAVAAAAIGLGVPGIRIELRPLSTPGPTATPASSAAGPSSSTAVTSSSPTIEATPPGQELGPIVSLEQARANAGFGLLVPTAPGSPEPLEVHLAGVAPFTRATLVYADLTRLTEFLGAIQPDAFGKIVGPGTTVDPVSVGASHGFWIEGAPHQLVLLYRDGDGVERWREITVTGHVLIWEVGAVTLRLETPLDRAAAIALAVSLR